MKILNLYAGVGGNRMLWGDEHEITAVELNESVANCYKTLHPNDNVVVADAHQYLLDHFYEYDFIWSSPPCQTHSNVRQKAAAAYYFGERAKHNGSVPVYPDMKLWQEIIFLQHHARCNWVVENVIPYYKPFIQPTFQHGKHLYWSNKFIILPNTKGYRGHDLGIDGLQKVKRIDLSNFKFEGISKRQVLRNMVEPEDGKLIFELITKE